MAVQVIGKDDQYILNHCTKFLARDNTDFRHNFGQFPASDTRARICETWRFPIIDSYNDGQDSEVNYRFNEVTFIYPAPLGALPQEVGVLGTFGNLYEALPLRPITDTPYYGLTVVIPKGEVHTYKYLVDGQLQLDPVNAQRVSLDNGQIWSRFFTQLCTVPLSLERWEAELLDRLTDHILPFRTPDGENFLNRFYDGLDRQKQITVHRQAYRLDRSIGVVNFIDKLLAREESHHLIDYQICLELIDQILRNRDPVTEPSQMSRELFVELYAQMASDAVMDWDYGRYGSPRYFLQLLRRHTFTGAFSHPKYGGNAGAAGWAYLEERYRDPDTGKTLFDWRRSQEQPLGNDPNYRG